MYTYPQPWDNPQQYAPLVGSFWAGTYEGVNLVLDYLRGVQLNQQQLFGDILELQQSVGYRTCPVYHTQNWFLVSLFKSMETVADPLLYGGGQFYGPQPVSNVIYTYGQALDTAVAYPLQSNVKHGYFACTSMTNSAPSVSFTEGIDYVIRPNSIAFLESVFNNPNIFKTPVLDATGAVVDYRIDLFFFKAQLDWNYLSQQFGYIVNVQLPSSDRYQDFLVGTLSGIASGTSYDTIAQVLEACADAPRVLTNGETVEVITNDANSLLIITNVNVYHFSQNATPIVSVGQVVNQDDQLTDVITIYTPNQGNVPPLDQLVLDNAFLDPSIAGELTFQNESLPTTVTTVDGYTQITWPLGGATADVAQFFTVFLNKGIEAGKTLAQCLDTRPQPQTSQPGPSNLPTAINPMAFLFQNVLRYNAFVVVLNVSAFGPNALGSAQLDIMRRLVPPSTTVIFFAEVTQTEDDAPMNDAGDIEHTGYTENYSVFTV